MLKGYTFIEDVESDCLLHQYTALRTSSHVEGIPDVT